MKKAKSERLCGFCGGSGKINLTYAANYFYPGSKESKAEATCGHCLGERTEEKANARMIETYKYFIRQIENENYLRQIKSERSK